MWTKATALFLLLIFGVTSLRAHNCASNTATKVCSSDGSLADTQAMVDYVDNRNEAGWVMNVGVAGGSYTWASPLSISIEHLNTIQGASPTNRPTITSSYTGGFGIVMDATANQATTLKDMIFTEVNAANGLILVTGGGVCFRFTNLKWIHGNDKAAAWIGTISSGRTDPGPYGVIDGCEILGSGYGFYMRDNDSLTSWERPHSFGTENAVYIESSTFGNTTFQSGRPITDGSHGARFVFRYNTVVDQAIGTHGADSPGLYASILQFEVMHNTFRRKNNAGATIDMFFYIRGGTGVMFDNTITADSGVWGNSVVKLAYFRATPGNGVVVVDKFYPGDYVGTQQPGSGVVAVAGQDPDNPTRKWGSVPFYYWNNTRVGPGTIVAEVNGDSTGFIALNRDYFVNAGPKPGYSEYTFPHPLRGGQPGTSPTPTPTVAPTPTPTPTPTPAPLHAPIRFRVIGRSGGNDNGIVRR